MSNKKYIYDPIEDTEEYKKIEEEVHQKILVRLGGKLTRGNAYLYPLLKKEILKNDYNIEWKSPQELNPNIKFN